VARQSASNRSARMGGSSLTRGRAWGSRSSHPTSRSQITVSSGTPGLSVYSTLTWWRTPSPAARDASTEAMIARRLRIFASIPTCGSFTRTADGESVTKLTPGCGDRPAVRRGGPCHPNRDAVPRPVTIFLHFQHHESRDLPQRGSPKPPQFPRRAFPTARSKSVTGARSVPYLVGNVAESEPWGCRRAGPVRWTAIHGTLGAVPDDESRALPLPGDRIGASGSWSPPDRPHRQPKGDAEPWEDSSGATGAEDPSRRRRPSAPDWSMGSCCVRSAREVRTTG